MAQQWVGESEMKQNLFFLIFPLLCMLLVLSGCKMEKLEAVELETLPVTTYGSANLGDLVGYTPLLLSEEDIADWPENSLELESEMLVESYSLIESMVDGLLQDDVNFTYKPFAFSSLGIVTNFIMSLMNKELIIEDRDPPASNTSYAIEYLDAYMESKVDLIHDMISSMVFDMTFIDSCLASDGKLRVSAKVRTITDMIQAGAIPKDLVLVESLFADLRITGSKLKARKPTGYISGEVQCSIASNFVYERTSDQTIVHASPVVIQVEVAPFSSVSLHAVDLAIRNVYAAAEEEGKEPDYWSAVKPLVWGSDPGTLCKVTRIIGNSHATAIRKTDVWTNAEALALIFDMFM